MFTATGRDAEREWRGVRAGVGPTVQEGAGGVTSRVLLWSVAAAANPPLPGAAGSSPAPPTRLERSGGTEVAPELLEAARDARGRLGRRRRAGGERATRVALAGALERGL
jgi:hypothetical protein